MFFHLFRIVVHSLIHLRFRYVCIWINFRYNFLIPSFILWKESSWPNLGHYPRLVLQGLRKYTKSFNHDSWFPWRALNHGSAENEAWVLPTHPRHTVILMP
jgi:hypothetical protein